MNDEMNQLKLTLQKPGTYRIDAVLDGVALSGVYYWDGSKFFSAGNPVSIPTVDRLTIRRIAE